MAKTKSSILIVLIIISGVFQTCLSSAQDKPFEERPFVYGAQLDYQIPLNIDPHQAYASNSFDFIDQICEGLFSYDLTSPSMTIQPQLAKDFGRWQEKEGGVYGHQWTYTVELKNNIKFHDNTSFDAYDVEFSFNRLHYLLQQNQSSDLEFFYYFRYGSSSPLNYEYQPLKSLYPSTPYVINTTKALNATWIEFTLNYQYSPFEALLCCTGSYILPKPLEISPEFKYYNDSTDLLVGTGPYSHVSTSPSQLKLEFYPDYYGELNPDIKDIHWKFYEDIVSMNEGFLEGKTDYIKNIDLSFIKQYNDSKYHQIKEPIQGTTINYLGFDCTTILVNTRKAMQDALNYTFLIEEFGQDEITEMTSIIPKGILFHDNSISQPITNISTARLHILDAIETGELTAPDGFDLNENSSDEAWKSIALASYTYGYNSGNHIREGIGELIKENFAKIGLQIIINGLPVGHLYENIQNGIYQVYSLSWSPLNHDPSSYTNFMINNSIYNFINLNDSWLEKKLSIAVQERNITMRHLYYDQIQHYIFKDLVPILFLYTPYNRDIYPTSVSNMYKNSMGKLYFYIWDFDYSKIPSKIPSFPFLSLFGATIITVSFLLKNQFKMTKLERILINRAEEK
ncbi:ABC transporter substrate-binding protein [Candidatus Lokiarchaeum ossiferum]|uniref:ABC transporter substrate-binding protein n=1 Tax=Candidatus Lokiarchaeum ossiferum TaxID=2951803 RepID=UPI00352F4555